MESTRKSSMFHVAVHYVEIASLSADCVRVSYGGRRRLPFDSFGPKQACLHLSAQRATPVDVLRRYHRSHPTCRIFGSGYQPRVDGTQKMFAYHSHLLRSVVDVEMFASRIDHAFSVFCFHSPFVSRPLYLVLRTSLHLSQYVRIPMYDFSSHLSTWPRRVRFDDSSYRVL